MKDEEIVQFVQPYTCLESGDIFQILKNIERIRDVPGNIVEIGAWKGGSVMAMALKLKQLRLERQIDVYDTFTGMTKPTRRDFRSKTDRDFDPYVSSFEDTKRNIDLAEYPNISYHIGDIKETDVSQIPQNIAFLHLDTTWYDNTKFELNFFEPSVSNNGIIMVQDYKIRKGCQLAVDNFLIGESYEKIFINSAIQWTKIFELEIRTKFVLFVSKIKRFIENPIDSFNKYSYLVEASKGVKNVLQIEVTNFIPTVILLLANPDLKITTINYSVDEKNGQFHEIMARHFKGRYNFSIGDFLTLLPQTEEKFDLVFVDHRDFKEISETIECLPLISHFETRVHFNDSHWVIPALAGGQLSKIDENFYRLTPQFFEPVNSTIVTMIYDKFKDISKSLENIKRLFSLNHQTIVFTEEKLVSEIEKIAGKHVKIVCYPVERLPLYEKLDVIERAMGSYELKFKDETKNSSLYFVFDNSKPYLIHEAISVNPFSSSRFVWIDPDNLRNLEMAKIWLSRVPAKIRQMAINPFFIKGENLIQKSKEFFQTEKNVMCTAVISGSVESFKEYYQKYNETLENVLSHNWWILGDSISMLVYRQNPDLFDLYYGEHVNVIENYESFHRNRGFIFWLIESYQHDLSYHETKRILDYVSPKMLYITELVRELLFRRFICDYYVVPGHLIQDDIIEMVDHGMKYDSYMTIFSLKGNESNLRFYQNGKVILDRL